MEYEKIIELIHEVEQSNISEFVLKKGEFQIELKKNQPVAVVEHTTQPKKEVLPEKQPMAEKHTIASTIVGIFHMDSKEITVGKNIEKGQVLGAVEAMKLMNDVVADQSGRISEVLVKNGDLVEYGQPLFVIED